MNKIGIYRITSPSGKVYIGQSWDIDNRVKYYRTYNCKKQVKLYCSFKKYGWRSHTFKICHLLPPDVSQEVLDVYEQLYIDLHKETGLMMNLRGGGSKGKHSKESIDKMKMRVHTEKQKNSNRGNKHGLGVKKTDEQKKAMSERLKGKPMHRDTILGAIRYNKGLKHSEERVQKRRDFMIGKKYGLGHRWSDEEKVSISKRMKGKKNSLGRKLSDTHKLKISAANKNKPKTEKQRSDAKDRMMGNTFGYGKTGANSNTGRKVTCLDNGITYDTIRIAANSLVVNEGKIPQVCRGKLLRTGGLKFKYA